VAAATPRVTGEQEDFSARRLGRSQLGPPGGDILQLTGDPRLSFRIFDVQLCDFFYMRGIFMFRFKTRDELIDEFGSLASAGFTPIMSDLLGEDVPPDIELSLVQGGEARMTAPEFTAHIWWSMVTPKTHEPAGTHITVLRRRMPRLSYE